MPIPQLNKRKHRNFYSRVHSIPANQWRAMLYSLLSQSIALSCLPKHINCLYALRSFAFLSMRLRRTIHLELFNQQQRELLPGQGQTQFDKQMHRAWSQKLQKNYGAKLAKVFNVPQELEETAEIQVFEAMGSRKQATLNVIKKPPQR